MSDVPGTAEGELSVKTKLGYGVADIGVQILLTGTGLYLLNFLTDVALLGAALAGTALFISKIWDAVSDPLMGIISDRTRSRWGRRLPYLLFGAIPFGLSFFLVFTNPRIESQSLLFIYAIATYIILCTAYTVVTIPYLSLLPEMTKDFNEKTNILGYKSAFTIFGALLAGGALMPVVALFQDKSAGYMAMGALFGAMATIFTLVTFFALKKLPSATNRESMREQPPVKASLKMCLKNKPFLILCAAYIAIMTTVSIIMSMLIYYLIYWIGSPATQMTPVFLILMLTAALFLPFWVKTGEKLGKKISYIFGLSFLIAGLLVTFFIPQESIYTLYVAIFVIGVGFSTNYVFPHTMLPDTIEYDELLTGMRREGIYYGIFNFSQKFAFALGVFISGWWIKLAGYVPNITQSPRTLLGIKLLFGPISALIVVVGVIILLFYPISSEKYNEILSEIENRKSAVT